jgi:hypothetical protein
MLQASTAKAQEITRLRAEVLQVLYLISQMLKQGASFAAGRGATILSASVWRAATPSSSRRSRSAAWVFVAQGLLPLSSFTPLPLPARSAVDFLGRETYIAVRWSSAQGIWTEKSEDNMAKRKRKDPMPGPNATPEEIGEFWDTHSLADYWDETHEVEFQVNLKRKPSLIPVEHELIKQINTLATKQGLSPETLVNQWLREKLATISDE